MMHCLCQILFNTARLVTEANGNAVYNASGSSQPAFANCK